MTDSTFGSTVTADRSTTEQVNDRVRDTTQLAQDKAKGALGQARSRLRDQIDPGWRAGPVDRAGCAQHG